MALPAESVSYMVKIARKITPGTFRKYAANDALRSLRHSLGYTWELPMSRDAHVTYWKSVYLTPDLIGRDCVYLEHKNILHIFRER